MKILACCSPMFALALTACDDTPGEPRSMNEVVEEASNMTRPLPGQYNSTTELVKFEIPGAPAGLADQLKGMMGKQFSQSSSSCLTAEQAGEGFEEQFREIGEGSNGLKCDFDRFDVNGDAVDAKMTCSGPQEMTATMEMTGTAGEERQLVNMDMQMTNPQIPGGKMNIELKVVTERTGDCS